MDILVTILGGIAVGLVILVVEYRYFQRRRAASDALPASETDHPELPSTAPEPLRDTPAESTDEAASGLPWPEAINKALESFSAMHPNKEVELLRTDAGARNADLLIIVWEGEGRWRTSTGYSIRIDKAGEILTIRQN